MGIPSPASPALWYHPLILDEVLWGGHTSLHQSKESKDSLENNLCRNFYKASTCFEVVKMDSLNFYNPPTRIAVEKTNYPNLCKHTTCFAKVKTVCPGNCSKQWPEWWQTK